MAYSKETAYYNDFNASKKYFEVRALAGYVEQSREDNEIQSILRNIVKKLGDSIWREGELVSGGGYTRGTGSSVNTLTFNSSRVYIEGIVHDVSSRDITLSGSGVEEVGIELSETLVTPVEDASLKDPASGFANYGQPGANRLKIEATWALKTAVGAGNKFFPAYLFQSGSEQVQPRVGEIDVVTQQLARRTFDESGNYVVGGFDISLEPKNLEEIFVKIGNKTGVGNSKAYVQGYEIVKIADEKKAIPKALGTSFVENELVTFYFDSLAESKDPSDDKLRDNTLKLDIQPAARISSVVAKFDAIQLATRGSDTIIRNGTAGEANINVLKVFTTLSSTSDPAAASTTFVSKTENPSSYDYEVIGQTITWATGRGPGDGVQYYIYYTFTRPLKVGEECDLTPTGNLDLTRLKSKNTNTPKDGLIDEGSRKVSVFPTGINRSTGVKSPSEISVDYTYYLPRYDVIYLDASGEVRVQQGEYADKPSIPFVSASTLQLGHLYLPAGADYDKVILTPYNVRRITMSELRRLFDRVERAELNQGVLDLNAEATQRVGNDITTLSGILTEAFSYTADEVENPVVNGISRIKFNKNVTSKNIFNLAYRQMSLSEHEKSFLPLTLSFPSLEVKDGNVIALNVNSLKTTPSVLSREATETIQVNQFDYVKEKATLTLSAGIARAAVNSLEIKTFNPDTAFEVFSQTRVNRNDVRTSEALSAATSIPTFIEQQWIWCLGKGFKGNEAVDLTVGGQAVRLSVTSGGEVPVVPEELGTAPTAPALGFLGVVGNSPESVGSTIYPAGSRILTNFKGEFLVAFQTPLGLAPGNTIVKAESETLVQAAAILKKENYISLVDESLSIVVLMDSLVPEPVSNSIQFLPQPVELFVSAAAPANPNEIKTPAETVEDAGFTNIGTADGFNFTGGANHVYAKIKWGNDGGQPMFIKVQHTPLSLGGGGSTKVEKWFEFEVNNSRQFYGPREAVVYIGQATTSFDLFIELLNNASTVKKL